MGSSYRNGTAHTEISRRVEYRHSLEKAAYLHCNFVRIHSFIDGNGRQARLITNLELMKQGYPPVILPGKV
jgi:Fic family protein